MPDVNVSAAVAAFGRLVAIRSALEDTQIILDVLQNSAQVSDELERAIAQKRADLDALNTQTIDGAKAEGARERDQILADAKIAADQIEAAAAQKMQDADANVAAKSAELADLESKIATLRESAKALAGG
jgi:hypothetical protein